MYSAIYFQIKKNEHTVKLKTVVNECIGHVTQCLVRTGYILDSMYKIWELVCYRQHFLSSMTNQHYEYFQNKLNLVLPPPLSELVS